LPETATTDDPALFAAGQPMRPILLEWDHRIFALAAASGCIRLLSQSAASPDLSPWIDEHRRLGVLIRCMNLRRDDETTPIPLDHPSVGRGQRAEEWDGGDQWRWTSGVAELDLKFSGLGFQDVVLETMPACALHQPVGLPGPAPLATHGDNTYRTL
jgi:hypothetical protein